MTTSEKHTLRSHELGHRYGRNRLFVDVSFELTQPGSVVIAGPNGSGKSTFLKILMGFVRPTRGEVRLLSDGKALSAPAVRARLGLVSPDLQLYGELTTLENLVFFARLRGLDPKPQLWHERLVPIGLADFGHNRVGTLSSGQRQRLKYLVATMHDPALLLLDEPTANLDDAGRELVAAIVERQRTRGLLVVATNEKEEYAFGDRLVRLVA
jgi:heme exporter protein A